MFMEFEQGNTIFASNKTNSIFTTVTLVISSIGVSLSAFALLLLLITACLIQEWRQKYKNQLLIQFMLARSAYTFVRYFFDLRTIFSICGGSACVVYMDEALMIYTEIALVLWMFIFSRHMYQSLVVVFNLKRQNILIVSLATWIIPLIIALFMQALVNWKAENQFMIYFFYLALVKWPILIANAVVLIIILKSLTKPNKIKVNSPRSNTRLVVVMCFLIFYFCFQQAMLDIYKLVYVIFSFPFFILIFINISTMFHCAVAIMFWVFGNENTRKMWRNRLSCISKAPLTPQSSISTITKL